MAWSFIDQTGLIFFIRDRHTDFLPGRIKLLFATCVCYVINPLPSFERIAVLSFLFINKTGLVCCLHMGTQLVPIRFFFLFGRIGRAVDLVLINRTIKRHSAISWFAVLVRIPIHGGLSFLDEQDLQRNLCLQMQIAIARGQWLWAFNRVKCVFNSVEDVTGERGTDLLTQSLPVCILRQYSKEPSLVKSCCVRTSKSWHNKTCVLANRSNFYFL